MHPPTAHCPLPGSLKMLAIISGRPRAHPPAASRQPPARSPPHFPP